MGWSLLPNALRPFKIYCASPPITSQLILFLWQTIEIGPLGHVRDVEALQKDKQLIDWKIGGLRRLKPIKETTTLSSIDKMPSTNNLFCHP